MMNPEAKAKWVAALRSGKYKQGKSYLRTGDNEYCCLGVLCDVARKEGAIGNPRKVKDREGSPAYYEYGKGEERNGALLPESVQEWSGLYDSNPVLGDSTASWQNDQRNKTFEEIADLIEANL